jgi:hypothetical protein
MEENQSRGKHLPNLPGSTEEDLRNNQFNPFFKKTPKDVWSHAEVEHHQLKKDVEKCDHFFRYVKNGVECEKCRMGLEGHLEIKGGKLFYNGQKILS